MYSAKYIISYILTFIMGIYFSIIPNGHMVIVERGHFEEGLSINNEEEAEDFLWENLSSFLEDLDVVCEGEEDGSYIFSQEYDGIPVLFTEITVSSNDDGAALSGTYAQISHLNTTPKKSEDACMEKALSYMDDDPYDAYLCIYPKNKNAQDGICYLVYCFLSDEKAVYINAHTGRFIAQEDLSSAE